MFYKVNDINDKMAWRKKARLNICIVADGLYPNQTFFQICRDHGWSWIVTFKDGNLPSIWTRVLQRQGLEHTRRQEERVHHGGKTILRTYEWHPPAL